MIVETAVHPEWISNGYLIASGPGAQALVVDPGPPVDRLFEVASELDLQITHVLVTHRHDDHHENLAAITERFPDVRVLCHAEEQPHVPGATASAVEQTLEVGGLPVRMLETPGHTKGAISVLVDGNVFTGDTLFRRSVGGIISPGHTDFADLKRSIMGVLLALPPDTVVWPGHGDQTTVEEELEANPFVRIWRGVDAEGDELCVAEGEQARLILWATDYDGGHKAWIRESHGTDVIMAGSRVSRDSNKIKHRLPAPDVR